MKHPRKGNSDNTSKTVIKKASIPGDSDLRYYIRSPSGNHKKFKIQAYIEPVRGSRTYLHDDDERYKAIETLVNPINKQFLEGILDIENAKVILNDAITELYKKQNTKEIILKRVILSNENQKLLNKFWEEKYSSKILSDEASAKSDFIRALKLVDTLSLYTASAKDIQGCIKKLSKNTGQFRRAIDRLTEILKFLDRDIELMKPEEDIINPQYLTLTEVNKLASKAENREFEVLTHVLFGTGARLGEALAINKESIITEQHIFIGKQLTRKGLLKLPKRKKKGAVAVIKSEWEFVKEWSELDKSSFNRSKYYKWITETSRIIWPLDKSKWISPHDLRHSHAIYLLSKGATLTDISLNLRNRIEVCQKYYTGFAHKSETVDRLKGMI